MCLHCSCLWSLLPALPGLGFSLCRYYFSVSQLLSFTGASRYLRHYFHTAGKVEKVSNTFYALCFILDFLSFSWDSLGLFFAFKILRTYVSHTLRKAWTLGATYTSSLWAPSLRLFLCVIILMSRLGNRQVT